MSRAAAGTAVVLAHLAAVVLHGRAHARLGVGLSWWQQAFAALVIVAAPLVAAALLWTPRRRVGAVLLAGAMAGSLAFGVYHHYVAVSRDHVAHLPPGDAQGLFRISARLLWMSEIAGLAVALWAGRPRGEP